MNVHIYKGAVGKSVIFSQMVDAMEAIGIVLYSEDRPYVPGVFMAPREYVTPHDLAEEFLPSLLRDPERWGQTAVIYTNHTEEENIEYIHALKKSNIPGTVIVMCRED
jgi:hypothetical protein